MKNQLLINTTKMDRVMRSKVVSDRARKFLIARLAGSAQEIDLTAPANCQGYGRIRHFKKQVSAGWIENRLPIRPAAHWLNIEEPDMMEAQLFQLAGCAWRCWYCYVPYDLLSADPTKAAWLSAPELLELHLETVSAPRIIDLSGGSPDLAPEWIAAMMDAIEGAGIRDELYLWSDDNLSSDRLLQSDNKKLLRRIEDYGLAYGKVCCLKGFDEQSFGFNTAADHAGFEEQLRVLSGYVATTIDLHLYVTLTAEPNSTSVAALREFVNRLGRIRSDLPGRTVPLEIRHFSPMESRMNSAHTKSLAFQNDLIEVWKETVERNWS